MGLMGYSLALLEAGALYFWVSTMQPAAPHAPLLIWTEPSAMRSQHASLPPAAGNQSKPFLL